MNFIPIYALYGEERYPEEADWLHWETITSRSRLYGFRIAPHRHEQFFQILLLRKGRAQALIDGESFQLAPLSVVAVPPLCVHGYEFSEDVEGIVLTLFEREVRGLLADAPEVGDALLRPSVTTAREEEDGAAELHNAIRGLIREADRPAPGRSAALRARILLVLLSVFRLGAGEAPRQTDGMGRAGQLARAFQALVERDYRDTRSVPHYARELGVTPTHLNRVCRQVLGRSALSLIERRIILEAKRYLQFSTLSVKEIGILLGYPDPAYFSRFFLKAAGVPPSRFRRW
ncbi:helix-turn-helix domain-containing protein [Chelativorans sp.]|uniref:helix-turn-helix domain-containing protein n=1 Tax=Chelativorans sp. TaxID=2203393 RepID=UPI002811A956|nr:helix-turn-helix domain-containing protein [Chelativorans sp.]